MEGEEEDAALEAELESQLAEHRASLGAVNEALAADALSQELQEAQEALREAVGAAEEGLLHLKRSRLLREIEKSIGRGEEQGAGAGAGPDPDPDPDPEPEPGGFPVGGKCVFLHTDGRWYAGLVVQREGAGAGGDAAEDFLSKEPRDELRVTFLHPTAEKQQPCFFFLQGSCKFGERCRRFHGTVVEASSLHEFHPLELAAAQPGTPVLVRRGGSELWQHAEVVQRLDPPARTVPSHDGNGSSTSARYNGNGNSTNAEGGATHRFEVVLRLNGARAQVAYSDIAPAAVAPLGLEGQGDVLNGTEEERERDWEESDNESDSESDSESDRGEESEEEGGGERGQERKGLGAHPGPGSGAGPGLQDTVNIADWERHTRGVASRMMFAMGYRRGQGLGREGQGRAEPVEVRVIPAGRSLDFINAKGGQRGEGGEVGRESGRRRRKKRGGERSRRKKEQAVWEEARAELEREEGGDVFGFINQTLASSGDLASLLRQDQDRGGATHQPGPHPNQEEPGSWSGARRGDPREDRNRRDPQGRSGAPRGGSAAGGQRNSTRGSAPATSGAPSRKVLLLEERKLSEARAKVARLSEMAERNKRDKALHGAVMRRLEEAKAELARAQGSKQRHHDEISKSESLKKWAKF